MTKILKIGLVAGVNPVVAPYVKAAIFRAAAESGRTVELVEDELELRKDAPTERIALGDSKITGTASGSTGVVELDGKDTWVEYGLGANFNLTDSTYVWADVERTAGSVLDTDWRATVGVRHSF